MRVPLLLSLTAVLCQSGCVLQSNVPIENDYSYNAEFGSYKTYALFTDLSAKYPPSINTDGIKRMISKRMELLGYMLDTKSPDILVAYSIHKEKIELPGFSQPNINTWMRDKEGEFEYNEKTYKLKKGTLLIQIIDHNTAKCIWNGYITDTYRKMIFEDDRKLNLAVSQILDQYRFFANGFVERNELIVKESNR